MCFSWFFSVSVGDCGAVTSNLAATASLRILYLYYSQITISFNSVESELPRASLYEARIHPRVVTDLRTTCWDSRFYVNLKYSSRNMKTRLTLKFSFACFESLPPTTGWHRPSEHTHTFCQCLTSASSAIFFFSFYFNDNSWLEVNWFAAFSEPCVFFFSWRIFKMILTAVGIGCGQLYFKETLSPAVQFLAQLCIIIHTFFQFNISVSCFRDFDLAFFMLLHKLKPLVYKHFFRRDVTLQDYEDRQKEFRTGNNFIWSLTSQH
jgi:hypothetical protein